MIVKIKNEDSVWRVKMRTIEFVEKLKDIGAFVEIEQERVLVLYNDMITAEISRDDDSLADISLSEYNETVIPDEEKERSS